MDFEKKKIEGVKLLAKISFLHLAGTNQAAPSAQNFINAALGQGAGQSSQSTNQSGITQDMLTQALQSVQATMQATGQSPAQLDGANQNLAQAAQGVVSGKNI